VLTVPTVCALTDVYGAHDDYFYAQEFKVLTTVAAKLPAHLWGRIEARFKRPIVRNSGQTKTVARAVYLRDWLGLGAWHSAGFPVDCVARMAGTAPHGELELRGAHVFAGYWQNPERTQVSFAKSSWFRTGNLAVHRADGNFDSVGRPNSMIMHGNVLIHPNEIDEAMLRHPAVGESATFKMLDRMFGVVGVTAVVLRDADVMGEAQADALRKLLVPLPIDSGRRDGANNQADSDSTLQRCFRSLRGFSACSKLVRGPAALQRM